ncbi:MAG: EAL domain-containing protein [Proteobacteria bacterium]|nr:MAG: EAL domain-containing protein [Pseudomonadota bacterium]QKK11634.1 MAG: EAL domain-containing protein [Pseudomonadota bacterium]
MLSTLRSRFRRVVFVACAVLAGTAPHHAAASVVFGSDRDYPPFEYLDSDGIPRGFNVDLIRAVGEAGGFEIAIKLGPWAEIRRAFETEKTVHIADMTRSREREIRLDFATPFAIITDQLFARKGESARCDPARLDGTRVLVQDSASTQEYLATRFPGVITLPVPSAPDAIRQLQAGNGDCAIVTNLISQYLITRQQIRNVVPVGRPFMPREYGFAVLKGNTALLDRVNSGLKKVLESGEYATIYQKWFTPKRVTPRTAGELVRDALPIAGPIAAALLLTGFWVISLRRLVRSRTFDLREELARRETAEQEARTSHEQFNQLANNVDEVLWIKDQRSGAKLYVSPAYERIWELSREDLYRDPLDFLRRVHPEDYDRVKVAQASRPTEHYNEEYRIVRPDGSLRWVVSRGYPICDEQGEPYQMVGITRDITERKMAEERIEWLATRDALTELPNRYLLGDRLKQSIAHAQREELRLAVLFIDLDRFKRINDSLGHTVGDELLREVATRLNKGLRADDSLARIGGDEFVLVLRGIQEAEEILPVVTKIISSLAQPFAIDAHQLNISCSVGISIFPDDATTSAELLRCADTAMYHAKTKGRNDFCFYAAEMNSLAVERLRLEGELRRALADNEFELFYQPIVAVSSGQIVACEALIRWRHPVRGMVAPDRFIEVAEEMGLIPRIGAWVIESACLQRKRWSRLGYPLRMCVNVSALQLNPGLLKTISDLDCPMTPESPWLELELTESVLIENREENIELLRELKALGVSLSIDDFGTGYSSLSYLKGFPVETLKIDRSFIADLESDEGSLAIINAVASIAKTLNLRLIAEGVENEAQLVQVRRTGCDEYQGYLFQRPLPAEELSALLQAQQPVRH